MSGINPQYKERPRDWQNLFAITRFRYIKVFFCFFAFSITGVLKEVRSFYRGLCYIERGSL